MVSLADELGIRKFSVLGISGGGPYAAVCAYAIPKRIVQAGIVVGLSPIYGKEALDGMIWTVKIGWRHYYHSKLFDFLGSMYNWLVMTAGTILRSGDNRYVSSREGYRQGLGGPMLDLKLYTQPWGFDIAKIQIPVRLWYGGKDINVSPSMGRYYSANLQKVNSKFIRRIRI